MAPSLPNVNNRIHTIACSAKYPGYSPAKDRVSKILAKRKEYLRTEGICKKLDLEVISLLTKEQVKRARETISPAGRGVEGVEARFLKDARHKSQRAFNRASQTLSIAHPGWMAIMRNFVLAVPF